jgi:hypothetical protein
MDMADDRDPPVPHNPDDIDDVPVVACSRCDEEWALDYELDELGVGNQALEAFALDHFDHTGHFPDDVTPWIGDCQRCPETVRRLEERAVRRWAETHARHTRHRVLVDGGDLAEPAVVDGR